MKKKILLVDDDQRMLDALRRTLHDFVDEWDMTFIQHPEEAWKVLKEGTFDAVVTDVRMPGITGFDLLDRIQHDEEMKDVPVVILTGLNDNELKEKALDGGALDLLNKPVPSGELIARLRSALRIKHSRDDLLASKKKLAEVVQRQTADLAQSRMSIVCRLGRAAEFRDEDTGNHVIRVGCYAHAVAAEMGMPCEYLEMLLLAAPLHDIGKIGIPDGVLLKPGPLSDEEWTVMQRHCEIGEKILREQSKAVVPLFEWYSDSPDAAEKSPGRVDPMLEMAASIALTHHEHWDGSGYPRGISGEAIPLESRIVAIADVYDALTSTRPYRFARPEEEALTIIASSVGSHFDPLVHAAFLRALPEIRSIQSRFADDVEIYSSLQGATA